MHGTCAQHPRAEPKNISPEGAPTRALSGRTIEGPRGPPVVLRTECQRSAVWRQLTAGAPRLCVAMGEVHHTHGGAASILPTKGDRQTWQGARMMKATFELRNDLSAKLLGIQRQGRGDKGAKASAIWPSQGLNPATALLVSNAHTTLINIAQGIAPRPTLQQPFCTGQGLHGRPH